MRFAKLLDVPTGLSAKGAQGKPPKNQVRDHSSMTHAPAIPAKPRIRMRIFRPTNCGSMHLVKNSHTAQITAKIPLKTIVPNQVTCLNQIKITNQLTQAAPIATNQKTRRVGFV